jgi:predicted RNase H-like HicB family nuclease
MVCSKQDNGTYFAVCPEIRGCFTQGDTYEKTVAGLKELIEITLKEELDDDEKQNVLQSKSKIFQEFEISL